MIFKKDISRKNDILTLKQVQQKFINENKQTVRIVETRLSRMCCQVVDISSKVSEYQREMQALKIERNALKESRLLDEKCELGKIRSENLRERSRLREDYNIEKDVLQKDLDSLNISVQVKRKELLDLEDRIRDQEMSRVNESPEKKLKSLQELYESAQENFDKTLCEYQSTIRASKRDIRKLKEEVTKVNPSSWAVQLISAQQSALKQSVTKLRLEETKRSLLECQKRLIWVTEQGAPTGIPKQPSTPIFTKVMSRFPTSIQPTVPEDSVLIDDTVLVEQSRLISPIRPSLPKMLTKLDFDTPVRRAETISPDFDLNDIKMESRLGDPTPIQSPTRRASSLQREIPQSLPHFNLFQKKKQSREITRSLNKINRELDQLRKTPYMRKGRSEINTNPNQQSRRESLAF